MPTAPADSPAPKQISIPLSEFRRLALGRLVALLRDVADREDQRATSFVKRAPAPLERFWTTLELKIEAHTQWEAVKAQYPPLGGLLAAVVPILEQLESAGSAYLLLHAYEQLWRWKTRPCPSRPTTRPICFT